jgi:hydrogenase nickel incorporation protein HypA/HybF
VHELSVCLALIEQVESIARDRGASGVERIHLRVGPLSGIEPPLIRSAFPLAAAGTLAERARLEITTSPVRVRCRQCGAESGAEPNRLVCAACGAYRTELVSGDEMLLASLELVIPDAPPGEA